ncbi:MAG TPA: hypothetical protein VFN50_06990 [Acidimicrobiales bacterium]|nr:hypothetical protein [Acidimicrobiales bacterium]
MQQDAHGRSDYPLGGGGVGPPPASERQLNLRRVRRVSNWSIAALVVGVGTTTAALAHALPGQSPPAVYVTPGTTGATATNGGHAPGASSPVAVTSGSGVVQGGSGGGTGGGSTGGYTWSDS